MRGDRLVKRSAGEKRARLWKKWQKKGVMFAEGFSLDEVLRHWRLGLSEREPPWKARGEKLKERER